MHATKILLLSAVVPSLSFRTPKQDPTVEIARPVTEEATDKVVPPSHAATDALESDASPFLEPKERDGTAICIVGQQGRLEVRSKVANLLRPLDESGYNPRVFLVLERGSKTIFSNGYSFARAPPDFAQFHELKLDVVHKDYTQEPNLLTNWSKFHYNRDFDEEEKKRRMSNYINQFSSWAECMKLVKRSELARGSEYDAVIKLRDDSIVLSPLNMTELMAGRRVMTKGCARWFNGINDKVAVLPREYADAYMNNPLRFLEGARNGVEPYTTWATLCVNTEQMVWAALQGIPRGFLDRDQLPIVDGRPLGNGRFCIVPFEKDCHPRQIHRHPVCKHR